MISFLIETCRFTIRATNIGVLFRVMYEYTSFVTFFLISILPHCILLSSVGILIFIIFYVIYSACGENYLDYF